MGKIQRELKKLWQQSDQTATRASRLNLVIYNSGESSIRANTALVEKIARQHAIRAIIIAAKPQLPGNTVRAWVNAHCQINNKGAKQRCSEQIAFELTGEARQQGLTPNIILGNLDSDLPLYFWRQGEFSNPSEQLMAWVDRLIFDSADWPKPGGAIRVVAADQRGVGPGIRGAGGLELDALGRVAVCHRAVFRHARRARLALETGIRGNHARSRRGRADACAPARRLAGGATRLAGRRTGGTLELPGGERPDRDGETGGRRRGRRRHPARESERAGGRRGFHGEPRRGSDFFNTCAHCGSASEQRQVLPVGPEELIHGGARQRGTRPRRRDTGRICGRWKRSSKARCEPPCRFPRPRLPLGGMAATGDGQLRGGPGRAASARAGGHRARYFFGSFLRQHGGISCFCRRGCSGSASRSTRISRR